MINKDKLRKELLANLKENALQLNGLLIDINDHWVSEDFFYRYYHSSFKVYQLQENTETIVQNLKSLMPKGCKFNSQFMNIINDGTGKTFDFSHNEDWDKHTRPILEAFSHAKYFLEMAVKYGEKLCTLPDVLPSGWAAILYLYGLR